MTETNQEKSIEEIEREVKQQYFKQWRANNKDRVKMHNATYWRRRAEQIKAENRGDVID